MHNTLHVTLIVNVTYQHYVIWNIDKWPGLLFKLPKFFGSPGPTKHGTPGYSHIKRPLNSAVHVRNLRMPNLGLRGLACAIVPLCRCTCALHNYTTPARYRWPGRAGLAKLASA